MKVTPGMKKVAIALMVAAILLTTAYLASLALHNWLVPEEKGPCVLVTVRIEDWNNGIGWTDETTRLTANVESDGEYNFGIRMTGLMDELGVVLRLNISGPGISTADVNAIWFDRDANTWSQVQFIDKGDRLVGVIGPPEGWDVTEDFNKFTNLLITFHITGELTFEGYGQPVA